MQQHWKKIKGWGGSPTVKASILFPETVVEVQTAIRNNQKGLARGGGSSYGDSSLHTTIISTQKLTRIISAGEDWIEVEAGATIEQVLQYLLPRRRFLAVTPGTQAVTIGGAIASDVHGKNHASAGSFFNSTESLWLVDETGKLLHCSRQENADSFYQCFGGMGLQGIIVSAVIKTIPLPASLILERQFMAESFSQMLGLMEEQRDAPYLVGWLDLLNRKFQGIVKTGEWEVTKESAMTKTPGKITLPFRSTVAPPRFLFQWYNRRYAAKALKQQLHSLPLHQFFYPLDGIRNWRYAFGPKGLLQYHFRLPLPVSEKGLATVVQLVKESKAICTLAVLKRFGKGNAETPNSFAQEGYNLALDFIHTPTAVQLIRKLDEVVAAYGGQVYKAKDAFSRLPQALPAGAFQSLQNNRYATTPKTK